MDVYRGTVAPQRSFLRLATYIAMFPPADCRADCALPRCGENADGASHHGRGSGTRADALCAGPFKKVLLANQLGAFAAALQSSGEQTVLLAWLSAIAFTLQIYFDFFGLF